LRIKSFDWEFLDIVTRNIAIRAIKLTRTRGTETIINSPMISMGKQNLKDW
jgi:hypothetical protein